MPKQLTPEGNAVLLMMKTIDVWTVTIVSWNGDQFLNGAPKYQRYLSPPNAVASVLTTRSLSVRQKLISTSWMVSYIAQNSESFQAGTILHWIDYSWHWRIDMDLYGGHIQAWLFVYTYVWACVRFCVRVSFCVIVYVQHSQRLTPSTCSMDFATNITLWTSFQGHVIMTINLYPLVVNGSTASQNYSHVYILPLPQTN